MKRFDTDVSRFVYLPLPNFLRLQRKMTLSDKSLAGPGYVILNAIRTMNIISFLAVIAASVVMLVKTTTASKVCSGRAAQLVEQS